MELLLSDFLLFHFVNGLNQDLFVLELITLGCNIEMMIDVLVNLLVLSILDEESSQDSLSSDPHHLDGHSSSSGSLSLSGTLMSSSSLFSMMSFDSGSGVHVDLSLHDEPIFVEFSDVLSRVG